MSALGYADGTGFEPFRTIWQKGNAAVMSRCASIASKPLITISGNCEKRLEGFKREGRYQRSQRLTRRARIAPKAQSLGQASKAPRITTV